MDCSGEVSEVGVGVLAARNVEVGVGGGVGEYVGVEAVPRIGVATGVVVGGSVGVGSGMAVGGLGSGVEAVDADTADPAEMGVFAGW